MALQNELERCFHAYLATSVGFLSNEVDQSLDALSSSDPPEVVNIAGVLPLHFYKGEVNTERILPCVIIKCDTCERDWLNGNSHCLVEIEVVYQSDDSTDNPDVLSKIQEVSDTLIDYLRLPWQDLRDQLNRYRSQNLTVIGLVEGDNLERETKEGRTFSHMISLNVEAANADVIGQTDEQEAALDEVLQG